MSRFGCVCVAVNSCLVGWNVAMVLEGGPLAVFACFAGTLNLVAVAMIFWIERKVKI